MSGEADLEFSELVLNNLWSVWAQFDFVRAFYRYKSLWFDKNFTMSIQCLIRTRTEPLQLVSFLYSLPLSEIKFIFVIAFVVVLKCDIGAAKLNKLFKSQSYTKIYLKFSIFHEQYDKKKCRVTAADSIIPKICQHWIFDKQFIARRAIVTRFFSIAIDTCIAAVNRFSPKMCVFVFDGWPHMR